MFGDSFVPVVAGDAERRCTYGDLGRAAEDMEGLPKDPRSACGRRVVPDIGC